MKQDLGPTSTPSKNLSKLSASLRPSSFSLGSPARRSWCRSRLSLKKSTQLSIHPLGCGVPPMVLSTAKPNLPAFASSSCVRPILFSVLTSPWTTGYHKVLEIHEKSLGCRLVNISQLRSRDFTYCSNCRTVNSDSYWLSDSLPDPRKDHGIPGGPYLNQQDLVAVPEEH
jgi:hypothetical protein